MEFVMIQDPGIAANAAGQARRLTYHLDGVPVEIGEPFDVVNPWPEVVPARRQAAIEPDPKGPPRILAWAAVAPEGAVIP